jgi:hypothetical protein
VACAALMPNLTLACVRKLLFGFTSIALFYYLRGCLLPLPSIKCYGIIGLGWQNKYLRYVAAVGLSISASSCKTIAKLVPLTVVFCKVAVSGASSSSSSKEGSILKLAVNNGATIIVLVRAKIFNTVIGD